MVDDVNGVRTADDAGVGDSVIPFDDVVEGHCVSTRVSHCIVGIPDGIVATIGDGNVEAFNGSSTGFSVSRRVVGSL